MKKKIIISTLLWLLSVPLFSQSVVSFVLKNLDADAQKNVVQVNISGKILRMAADSDTTLEPDMKRLFENIDRIEAVIGVRASDYRLAQVESRLTGFEELLSVIENSQTIRMYTREVRGRVEEFVLSIRSGEDLTLVSISGRIDIKALSRLGRSVNVNGLEHLDKLN